MDILKVKLNYLDTPIPRKISQNDSWLDLVLMRVSHEKNNIYMFDFGLSIDIPKRHYAEINFRPGMYKSGLTMANGVVTIGSGWSDLSSIPTHYNGYDSGIKICENLIGTGVAHLILKKAACSRIEVVGKSYGS